MQFSEKWLRTYVDPDLSTEELAKILTMAGLEVESVSPVAPVFSGVVVGEIQAFVPHPQADRLKVCQVLVDVDTTVQIVCGASNVQVGAKVPCALVGAKLPHMEIKQVMLRGVDSFGMLCSAEELGLEPVAAEGLYILPDNLAVGSDLRVALDLDDQIFVLKITPNRADCLSILGIAREVSALTGAVLNVPSRETVSVHATECRAVTVDATEACPVYVGRAIVNIDSTAETPIWMRQRIERCGLRCVHPVVDVTNYVMLEVGQPLHAFDLTKTRGSIVVRWAKPEEKIRLLNEDDVTLTEDFLVIADEEKPLALAGIMGGLDTGVVASSQALFLESAFFMPQVIAGRARRLNITSDAAYRFERGVDPDGALRAIEYATQLILAICGGQAGTLTAQQKESSSPELVRLRPERVARLLGFAIPLQTLKDLLSRAAFSFVEDQETGALIMKTPSHRFDLKIEEDWVEEVARLYGYERIPAQTPQVALRMLPATEKKQSIKTFKNRLMTRGYQEVITYSFVADAHERRLAKTTDQDLIRLKNPIANHLNVMRSTLWGGLIEVLQYNLHRRQDRLRVFEVGRCFLKMDNEIVQPTKIGGLAYGSVYPTQWGLTARAVDFYDLKGDLELLISAHAIAYEPSGHPALHPGRSVQLKLAGECIGFLGELHPRLQRDYDLPKAPVLFELDLLPLLEKTVPQIKVFSKFPAIRRDIALLVEESIPAGDLLAGFWRVASTVVVDIQIFDLFRGETVPQGKKSLAFLIVMQDTQRTLTDPEADAIMNQLIDVAVQEFNAVLR